MSQVKRYLQKRRSEIKPKVNEECLDMFEIGFDFIEERIEKRYEEVDPQVSRKVELLEALLFAFIEHAMNLDLLEDVDKIIQDVHIGESKRVVQ